MHIMLSSYRIKTCFMLFTTPLIRMPYLAQAYAVTRSLYTQSKAHCSLHPIGVPHTYLFLARTATMSSDDKQYRAHCSTAYHSSPAALAYHYPHNHRRRVHTCHRETMSQSPAFASHPPISDPQQYRTVPSTSPHLRPARLCCA